MPITCRILTTREFFSDIRLMAGASGLDRIISWPYIGQTASISEWVYGGELLFVTGTAHAEYELTPLLRECIAKNLSGIVILIGGEHIKKLPQELLELADSVGFPVFTMPWEHKLIDITRELTQLILFDHLGSEKLYHFFSGLLASPQEKAPVQRICAENSADTSVRTPAEKAGRAYNNSGINRLLRVQDPRELELYCQSRLQRLLEDKQATLLETLKAYLEASSNLSRTAMRLNVHRNTMVYRIRRISELLQIDLDDPQQCMELLLALLIKDYLEKKHLN